MKKILVSLSIIISSLMSFGVSVIPPDQCINPELVCPDCQCIKVIDPVCGCNGIMYENACEAQKAGVTSWISSNDVSIVGPSDIRQGETVALTCKVNSTNENISYFWYIDENNIIGTSQFIFISPLDTTTYFVSVSIGRNQCFPIEKKHTINVIDKCQFDFQAPKVLGYNEKGLELMTINEDNMEINWKIVEKKSGETVKWIVTPQSTMTVWNGLKPGTTYEIYLRYYSSMDNITNCPFSEPNTVTTAWKPMAVKLLDFEPEFIVIQNPNVGDLYRYIIRNYNGTIIKTKDSPNRWFKLYINSRNAATVSVKTKRGTMWSDESPKQAIPLIVY